MFYMKKRPLSSSTSEERESKRITASDHDAALRASFENCAILVPSKNAVYVSPVHVDLLSPVLPKCADIAGDTDKESEEAFPLIGRPRKSLYDDLAQQCADASRPKRFGSKIPADVVDIDKLDEENELFCGDYAREIFACFTRLETEYRIDSAYMKKQKYITTYHRKMIVGEMVRW